MALYILKTIYDSEIFIARDYLTFYMLTYDMLNYSPKCAPAGVAGAQFSGYLNNQ